MKLGCMSGGFKGQMILLSGLLIAMCVALVSLYVTTASTAGSRISYSPWDLPYYEMRMGLYESIRAIKYYYGLTKDKNKTIELAKRFFRNETKIFALHGYLLNVNLSTNRTILTLNYTFKTNRVDLEVKKVVALY